MMLNQQILNFNLGVVAGSALSTEYIAQAKTVISSRMMYGGYRLSNLMRQIYGAKLTEELFL